MSHVFIISASVFANQGGGVTNSLDGVTPTETISFEYEGFQITYSGKDAGNMGTSPVASWNQVNNGPALDTMQG